MNARRTELSLGLGEVAKSDLASRFRKLLDTHDPRIRDVVCGGIEAEVDGLINDAFRLGLSLGEALTKDAG